MNVETILADASELAGILTALAAAYGWWRKKRDAKGQQGGRLVSGREIGG